MGAYVRWMASHYDEARIVFDENIAAAPSQFGSRTARLISSRTSGWFELYLAFCIECGITGAERRFRIGVGPAYLAAATQDEASDGNRACHQVRWSWESGLFLHLDASTWKRAAAAQWAEPESCGWRRDNSGAWTPLQVNALAGLRTTLYLEPTAAAFARLRSQGATSARVAAEQTSKEEAPRKGLFRHPLMHRGRPSQCAVASAAPPRASCISAGARGADADEDAA